MKFKTLPPGIAQMMVRGHEDILTPAMEQRQAKIERTPCPRCGSAMQGHIHANHVFTDAELLPRTCAKCVECGLILDPVTNLILDTGDPRKIEEALPIIKPAED